jgi:hypothetical protein
MPKRKEPEKKQGDKHSGLIAVSDQELKGKKQDKRPRKRKAGRESHLSDGDRDRPGIISKKSHDGEYCEEKRVDNSRLFQGVITPFVVMRIML